MATPVERWTPAGPIKSYMPTDEIEHEEGLTRATAGEPSPLGWLAWATGIFTLGTIFARWWPIGTLLYATTALFVFGGVFLFVAGMWSYRKGDTLHATAFTTFGAFGATYALFLWMFQTGLIVGPGAGFGVISIFFFCWSLIAAGLFFGALRRNLVLALIFGWAAIFYGLGGLAYLVQGSLEIFDFSGWAAIASAMCAFYYAAAIVINSEARKQVLPLGMPIIKPAVPPAPGPTVVERERYTG